MPVPITRHPRLAWPLLLSSISFAAIVVLYFVAEPNFYVPWPLVPAPLACSGAYYLIRYVQCRAAIRREVFAGRPAWPAVPFFPGKAERGLYIMFALSALMYSAVEPILSLSGRRTDDTRGLDDTASVAHITAHFLALAASVMVFIQAMGVRRAEAVELCAVAHAMQCAECRAKRGAPVTPQAPLPTDLHIRAMDALLPSIFLSLALCAMLLRWASATPDLIWVLIALGALNVVHRLFFLLRGRRARPIDWPSTRLFPGVVFRTIFFLGSILAIQLPVVSASLALHDERLAWGTGMPARAVLSMQLLLFVANIVAFFRVGSMLKAETRAACLRDGHRWRCTRCWSVGQDAEAGTAVLASAVYDINEEANKEDGVALREL